MKKIRTIVCCCSNGLGSSLIVELRLKEILSRMGKHMEVTHIPLSEANPFAGDLFVCGADIAPQLRAYPRVIVMKDLLSAEEMIRKLELALNSESSRFLIEADQ